MNDLLFPKRIEREVRGGGWCQKEVLKPGNLRTPKIMRYQSSRGKEKKTDALALPGRMKKRIRHKNVAPRLDKGLIMMLRGKGARTLGKGGNEPKRCGCR